MNEFERLEYLITKENIEKIKNKNILVLGLGGVGSYVVTSLVRSCICNITIVDGDVIDITNINRQIMAFQNNISKPKTEELKKIINNINNQCKVKTINEFINQDNITLLFDDNYDYIIDCCDTLNTKKLIIKMCLDKKIKFISCMGTANKMDPSKLEITTLNKTINDPIAKILRKWTKDEHLPSNKIKVISSTEVPIKSSKLGSNSFVPPSAGLLITSYIINDIVKG